MAIEAEDRCIALRFLTRGGGRLVRASCRMLHDVGVQDESTLVLNRLDEFFEP